MVLLNGLMEESIEMPQRMKEYRQQPEWLPGCALIVVVICLAAFVMLISD